MSFSINLFHFIILTRKPMINSSVNIIMAAIAFFDICTLLYEMQLIVQSIIFLYTHCFQSGSYAWVLFNLVLEALRDYSRRCSTWLCLSIALLRILVMKNPLNQKYMRLVNPIGAFYAISIMVLVNVPITVFNLMKYTIKGIIRKSLCFPNGRVTYYMDFVEAFTNNDGALLKVATTSNAIMTNVLIFFSFSSFLKDYKF